MTRNRIETLDVFRGLAIVLVVLFHLTARLPAETLNATGFVLPAIHFGWLGVDFFFVISGYCIFLTLDRSRSVGLFLARRFSRIYPAFIAAAVLLFVLAQFLPPPSVPAFNYRPVEPDLSDLLGNLLLLGGMVEWVNGSFWSIAVEVKFYIVVAVLALVVLDRGRFTSTFGVGALLLALAWVAAKLAMPWIDVAGKAEFVLRYFAIAPYLAFFAVGMIGYRMRRGEHGGQRLFVAALAVSTLVVIVNASGSVDRFGPVSLPVVVAVYAGLMALFVGFVSGRELLHMPVVSPLLARAGLVSYSWYLLHENVGIALLPWLNLSLPAWLSVIVAFVVTYIAAETFSLAVEWRFRKRAETLAMWFARLVGIERQVPFGPKITGSTRLSKRMSTAQSLK